MQIAALSSAKQHAMPGEFCWKTGSDSVSPKKRYDWDDFGTAVQRSV